MNDLRGVISHLTSDEGKADLKDLGGVSSTTAGVILRALVNLDGEGGDTFFGEPKLDPHDLLRVDTRATASSRCWSSAVSRCVRSSSPPS